jgi:hypothetical protein
MYVGKRHGTMHVHIYICGRPSFPPNISHMYNYYRLLVNSQMNKYLLIPMACECSVKLLHASVRLAFLYGAA